MMPSKRKSADVEALDGPLPVRVKVEGQSTDYSEDVKKKLSTASRTSTACDRCRVRKMRCDDQADGCAPCRQNHTECKTTDRITGKATVRGYVENLERRLQELEVYNHQLQARVMSLGGDADPDDGYLDPNISSTSQWPGDNQSAQGDPSDVNRRNRQSDTPNCAFDSECGRGDQFSLPDFRNGLVGNNYVGVSTGNSLLTSIRGTSLNVLGMEIDLANYQSADLDEPDPSLSDAQPVYNKSYRSFMQTAFGTSPKIPPVQLPPRKEGMEFVHIYFIGINPYLPIVYKPSFMKSLTRMYDDPSFQPSIADTVMVHTVFAIVHCQIAVRGSRDEAHKTELNNASNFHYHCALGFFAQLMASHTVADVQALTLLGYHVRTFPKPGPCWMLVSITLNLAIELGLHRSVKSWASTARQTSLSDIEIRKRVFWSLLILLVTSSGNLGRPLALRSEDWDVEAPEMDDDEILNEGGIDTSKPRTFHMSVGYQGFRVVPIFIDVYNNIYAVKRSPQAYIDTVRGLERRIREWTEQWPPEIGQRSATESDPYHTHAQYIEICPLHMRLLLRHPSLSLTSNKDFNRENLTVCMDVARKMLYHVKQLQKFQCLDGTWQTGALYVLAISTTLFGHWERRDIINANILATLKEEMAAWLSIIGDMSKFMGSGRSLQDSVRFTIERTLSMLLQHLAAKNARRLSANKLASQARSNVPMMQSSAPNTYGPPDSYQTYEQPGSVVGGSRSQTHPDDDPNTYMSRPSVATHTTPVVYQKPPQYAYQGPYANAPQTYDQQSYVQPNTLPATVAAADAYMTTYQQSQSGPAPFNSNAALPSTTEFHSLGSPSSWRQFAGSMTSNPEVGADYMSSASALMQLGRSEVTSSQNMQVGLESQGENDANGEPQQTWPFLVFENGSGVG